MANGLSPIQLLGAGGSEERGSMARLSSFVGATAIGDLVKTTLGPRGMDKILQSEGQGPTTRGEITITNDGATILKSVLVDNPAAKILIEISKTQDAEVGDGTTSVCVLASQILKQAENLVNAKIHPQTIIQGFRKAAVAAMNALKDMAVDHKDDPAKFREDLIKIAMTTLSSKVVHHDKEHFATLAVDASLRLHSTNLENIKIIKKVGGSLRDSYLEPGFILDKKIGVGQPKRVEKAKILIANTAMDQDKIKIFSTRVKADDTDTVAEIELAEREKMRAKVDKILKHDCNVFINRQLIYNFSEEIFADHNVMAIEHADFDGIERLAAVTGGEIVSTFDHPEKVRLGTCDLIEEIMIGEDKLIRFSGCPVGEACTIILRGASKQILDEAERALHDALCVITQATTETRTLFGGGAAEMWMSQAVDTASRQCAGKEALAMDAFALALRQLPMILAENAGYDANELVSNLRAEHAKGNKTACLNLYEGCIGDAATLGIVESFKVKQCVLSAAAEAAEMILRVDTIIRSPPARRSEDAD